MATGNFHNVHARKIYALVEQEHDDEFEFEPIELSEFIDDVIDDVQSSIEHKLLTDFNLQMDHVDVRDPHELRVHPSGNIGSVHMKVPSNIDMTVELVMVFRCGYYRGANLDWYPIFNICGKTTNDIEDAYEYIAEEVSDRIDIDVYNDDVIMSRYVEVLDTTLNDLIDKVESAFEYVSTPMVILARFSNGEVMYQKV
jgi:hypothetical protein